MAGRRDAPPVGVRPPREASHGGRLLVLLGLWGFAVTQPVLSVLGDEPSFFIFRETSALAAVVFAVGLAVGPPLLLALANLVVDRVHTGLGRIAHVALVGGLATVAGHVLVRRLGLLHPLASLGTALGMGAAFTWAYVRLTFVALWARYTAVLPALAVPTFLLLTPASDVFWVSSSDDGSVEAGDHPSVVFLVLDELPTKSLLDDRGEIDPVRFPNLAALAEDSTWYRGHTTVAEGTRQAVPAILSGLAPVEGEALMQVYPDNLFTWLRDTHEMRVSESLTRLCGFAGCRGSVSAQASLRNQLQATLRGAGSLWRDQVLPGAWEDAALDDFEEELVAPDATTGPSAENATPAGAPARFVDFLDSIERPTRPTLWYQHLLMPHQPWHLYPDGSAYDDPDPPHPRDFERWLMAIEEQQHVFQAQYTDRLVGQLLDRLKASELYDDSAVVIVADHGISFNEGSSQRTWKPESTDGIAFTPLLVKAPSQVEGRIDDATVLGYDVLPIVADAIGMELPWPTDGAPPGSPEIAARGTTRVIYTFGPLLRPRPRRTFEYDGSSHRPRAEDRWIRSIGADEPPLIGLIEVAHATPWLGTELDSLTTTVDGTASIEQLTALEAPASQVRPGFVVGRAQGHSGAGRILVAVDGVVVTAAPARLEGGATTFRAMLPPDLPSLSPGAVRVAWVPGTTGSATAGIVELRIER